MYRQQPPNHHRLYSVHDFAGCSFATLPHPFDPLVKILVAISTDNNQVAKSLLSNSVVVDVVNVQIVRRLAA